MPRRVFTLFSRPVASRLILAVLWEGHLWCAAPAAGRPAHSKNASDVQSVRYILTHERA
jgi:hypothetical protein